MAEQALIRLIGSCESFEIAEPQDEGSSAFTSVGELAHHVVGLAGRGGAGVAPVFAEAEALLVERDPSAAQLVIVGFLEDVQNIASHGDVTATSATFEPLLGEESRKAWGFLNALWAKVAADLIASGAKRVMDIRMYETIQNEGLRLVVQRTFRLMDDGLMVGTADVLRYEVDHGEGLHLAKAR